MIQKKWTKRVGLLLVIGLLTLIGVGCSVFGGEKETAKPAKTPSTESESAMLASGITLTYTYTHETEVEQGMLLYPLDAVIVYPAFKEDPTVPVPPEIARNVYFISAWQDRPEAVIELAWVVDAEAGTWTLYFADRTLISGPPEMMLSDATLEQWHEYVLSAPVGFPTGSDPDVSSVMVERSDLQPIAEAVKWDDAVTVEMLKDFDQNSFPAVQFLLVEKDQGQKRRTLVIIQEAVVKNPPVPPDDIDSAGQQHCSNCVWGLCKLSCWWYGR